MFVSDHERAIQNAHIMGSQEFENFQISPLLQNGETSWELEEEEEEEWGKEDSQNKSTYGSKGKMMSPSWGDFGKEEGVLRAKDLNGEHSYWQSKAMYK